MNYPSTATPPTGADKSRRRIGKYLVVVLIVAASLAAGGYYLYTRNKVSTDDAQVDGHIHLVTPRVTGYVIEVLVEDNQPVKAGQPLVRLDPMDFEVALAQEKASLAALRREVPLERNQTRFKVSGAEASHDSAVQAVLQAAQAESAAAREAERAGSMLHQAEQDYARIAVLAETQVVAQAELDAARTELETARAEAAAAQARLKAAQMGRAALAKHAAGLESDIGLAATGETAAEIKTSQMEAQAARVRQAELDLSYTTITAPTDGFVSRKSVEAGRLVSRGQALLAVVPLAPSDVWVTANFKETQLSRVRPGQRVTFEADAYPGVEFTGVVDSIQSGTGAVFSLFPPENASGNYVKVVQRVPVKIVPDPDQAAFQKPDAPVLRLGMSVTPTIHFE